MPEYRQNVGIILMNKDGLVLSGRPTQSYKDGTIQMPQGGIDAGETPLLAAKRELFEETGVKDAVFLKQSDKEYSYRFPEWVMKEREERGLRKYFGQTQHWILFLYSGTDIQADLKTRKDKELTDFEWSDIRTLPDKVVPFKKKVYTAVVKEFADFIEQSAKDLAKKRLKAK